MDQKISAAIESALLDQTEQALDELVAAALNCGLSKGHMGLMLQTKANKLVPPIIVPDTMTLQ